MGWIFAAASIYAFLVGLCVGSFLNVLIYRLPKGLSPAKGRSFCPNCQHRLSAGDLVPLLSYLFLKGRCRYCKEKISPVYPLVELLGGVAALLCVLVFSFSLQALTAFAAVAILIPIAIIDFQTLEIPNGLILSLLLPAAAAPFVFSEPLIIDRIIGAFAISLPMFLMNFIIHDSFGGGDIKLMFVAGFLLGWKNALFAGFVALFFGGIYAITLLVKKRKTRKDHFAFGPFLCGGAAAALLFGSRIIELYLSLF